MSPAITRTPFGSGCLSFRPRLSRWTSCPPAASCAVSVELMLPVPPMNRIFTPRLYLKSMGQFGAAARQLQTFGTPATRAIWTGLATMAFAFWVPLGCGGDHAAGPVEAGAPADAGDAAPVGVAWPPAIDPAAIGHAGLANVTVAAFSQVGTNA